MAGIPQKLCKIIISLAFATILAVAILRYNSGAVSIIVESRCQSPLQKESICAHCLRYPQSIHSNSLYKPAAEEKHRLGIRTCKNYSCSEMLNTYNEQSQTVRYQIKYIVSEFLRQIGASSYYQEGDKEMLRSARSWVIFTSGDIYPIASNQTINYFSQDIAPIILLACGLSLAVIIYVGIFAKNFNISLLKLICECIVMIGLVAHYNIQVPIQYHLILPVTHMAFVFFVLLCTKGGILIASLGACFSYIGWYLQTQPHNQFLSLLCIILINLLSVWSLGNRREDSIGFGEKLSGCLLLIYSILVIGEAVDPNYAPFRLLIIIFMNWTISITEVYSIDNVNFELYQKEGRKLNQDQNDPIELEADDLDAPTDTQIRG